MEDTLEINPLGSGREVGRSCVVLKFKGSTVMFDCGVHPAHNGLQALPFFDDVEPNKVDLLLVTHFHMDHCGAVPYFTEKTNFRGRVFMTHPTKAIYKILMHDAARVGKDEDRLFDERDILSSMEKVELIDYHQTLRHKGIKFWCYNAGHVLGAAMFMVEIAGVRVLYTGDFSREKDRHLLGAETPGERPHVLIVEATYGLQLHETREVREQRFCATVHSIVARGGRCLIPVFALGRSQELLLILDEYWKQNSSLHGVPIYYASTVAKKCMRVYQTYINMMNDEIIDSHAHGRNPWEFRHVRNLSSIERFDDSIPLVIMASPGMMQSGLSRDLFEMWCSDPRNGLMMPGYSVAGTLAHIVMSEPKDITTSAGDRLPVKLSIHYISFSAHSDYAQTAEFVAALQPQHIVLVHGGEEGMLRLQQDLASKYDPNKTEIYAPRLCQPVQLRFRGDQVTKVVGPLAAEPPQGGLHLGGLLLKKDFTYTLSAASGLHDVTPLACTTVVQRPRFRYEQSLPLLLDALRSLFTLQPLPSLSSEDSWSRSQHLPALPWQASSGGSAAGAEAESVAAVAAAAQAVATERTEADEASKQRWRVGEAITLSFVKAERCLTLDWEASPVADLLGDAVTATLLQLQAVPLPRPTLIRPQLQQLLPAVTKNPGSNSAATAALQPANAAMEKMKPLVKSADQHRVSGSEALRRLLNAHFGEMPSLAAAASRQHGELTAAAATAAAGVVAAATQEEQPPLEVAGQGPLVHRARGAVVKCGNVEATQRVGALLARAHRVTVPTTVGQVGRS